MPSHPLSFSPSTLYKVRTGNSFIKSPKALSSGDNKVPVPFDILRSFLTINIALFAASLAFKVVLQCGAWVLLDSLLQLLVVLVFGSYCFLLLTSLFFKAFKLFQQINKIV